MNIFLLILLVIIYKKTKFEFRFGEEIKNEYKVECLIYSDLSYLLGSY